MPLVSLARRRFRLALLGAALSLSLAAAEPSPAHRQRAEKMVATLGVDADKAARVTQFIAEHYRDVNALHDRVAGEVKRLKLQSGADKAANDAAIKAARDAEAPKLAALHEAFLGKLANELTPAQIDQVKDGMTFGVLPLTFKVYQEMLPTLTAEQKAQIHAWLVEAREHAMDAGSAEEKHAWFGKYKGRINNYLAKAGYDMKQAEREMSARQKAAKATK